MFIDKFSFKDLSSSQNHITDIKYYWFLTTTRRRRYFASITVHILMSDVIRYIGKDIKIGENVPDMKFDVYR